jgi:uncharacterized membrane protein
VVSAGGRVADDPHGGVQRRLAYLVSFGTIGVVWLELTVVTEYLDHVTSALVRLNLLLLMVVSILPFTTGLLAEYVGEESSARVAVTVYGVNLFVVSVVVSLLWRYVLRDGLVRPDADADDVRMLTKRLTPGLAGYVAVIVAGLFLPVVAVFGYLAIAVYFLVPWHALRGKAGAEVQH